LKSQVDVLIPTCERPEALAVTLASLGAQTHPAFRVIVSDQTEGADAAAHGAVKASARWVEHRGHPVEFHKNVPRRGMAQQRQFLLDRSSAPTVWYLDDDVIVDPDLLERLSDVLEDEACGFVGAALIGLSYRRDVRPDEQRVELWEGPVTPETLAPGTPEWERWPLHNAANVLHAGERLGATRERTLRYKVAWVGGCVLYDAAKLRAAGGFSFWRDLPESHAGEDVVAQQRVMARFGGCGILPSGAYHQELPTTIPDRDVDAPAVLSVEGAS
jgi:GT2 family glycosyltransferase